MNHKYKNKICIGLAFLSGVFITQLAPISWAQDGAAVAVAIKEVYNDWIKTYTEFKKDFDTTQNKINGHLEIVKQFADQKRKIEEQEEHLKKMYNQLLSIKKEPLKGTLPDLQAESQPLFQALEKTGNLTDRLLQTKKVTGDDAANISKVSQAETFQSLSSNSLYQSRKLINSMKIAAGSLDVKDKSAAQVFTEQSGVVVVEQLQAIGEKLDILVDLEIYRLMRENPDFYPNHKAFGKAQIKRATELYKAGEGAIKGIEVPKK